MHLNLSSLNHAAVHFLPSLFGVAATRESYKTETLFMPGKRKTQIRMPLTPRQHLASYICIIIVSIQHNLRSLSSHVYSIASQQRQQHVT